MYESGGFTAKKIKMGSDILKEMNNDRDCVKFLSFPACIIATGLRGIIRDLVKKKLADVVITTCGTLDHDLARVWKDYYHGRFDVDDADLHKHGINRLGNIFVPNESYGIILEKKMQKILSDIYNEQKEFSTKEIIWKFGEKINEYLEDAFIIRNGKVTTVPSLTEVEKIEFNEPWGVLEAFHTSGGSSSLPMLFEGKINELTYKTIRFPGHCRFFQFLKEFNLLSSEPFSKNSNITPREVVESCLQKHLPKSEPDAVLARISTIGYINGQRKKIIYELIDYMDESTNFSAMARTTAFPTSIIGQFISMGIIESKGVLHAEKVIPYDLFIDEVKKRNITLTGVN